MQSPDSNWLVPIEVMLGSLNHGEVQACSISRVADELRVSKEESYKPKVISIGPLHRGTTRQLQLMEEPKWHYMKEFLDRQGTQDQTRSSESRLRDCGTDLLKLDKLIRASYGGNIETEPNEIAKIMIVDGCFLLEFLIRLGKYIEGNQTNGTNQTNQTNPTNQTNQINRTTSYNDDPIFKTQDKMLLVVNDITMLENQIPFVVLKKLYRKVFPNNTDITNDHRVADIVRKAFGYPLTSNPGGAHILHLMHLSTLGQPTPQQQEGKRAKQELFRCANKLLAAGIILRSKPNTQNQHILVDKFDFDIKFDKGTGELEIPTLYVKETTEVKWRNLIAWEQSKIWIQCKYTSYAWFFKGLICCKHDIELLVAKKIIVNQTKKSTEDLVRLFKMMPTGAEHMDSSYSEICDDLNEYKGTRVTRVLQKYPLIAWHQCRRVIEMVVYIWRNWYNVLIRDHIPSVWKFIGIVAAIVLLVCTIMQTYYSSESSNSSKNKTN